METQTKCSSIDRHSNPCRNRCLTESRFCKFHQHMNDYTDDMLQSLKLCSGCNKMYFLEEGNKICETCKSRSNLNRSVKKSAVIICSKEECKYKRSLENKYCKLHQIMLFVDETESLNKKMCVDYIRGCRNQLDVEYSFSKCQDCLQKDREKDNEQRSKALQMPVLLENNQIMAKACTTCCKMLSIDYFTHDSDNETITKTCKQCRDSNKIQNDKRDKDHRNAVTRGSTKSQYYSYAKNAPVRNLSFELSYEQYESIVKQPCYYCETLQERGINGIDRKDNDIGYILDNCVSCCQLCNYMKHNLHIDVFFKRIEHILTYHQKINGSLYPDCFANHLSVSFISYKNAASNRRLVFLLSSDEFDNFIKDDCYICGKSPTEFHKNGLDRYNNDIGYLVNNVKACCGDCNIMKRIYSFDDMLCVFMKIYEKHIHSS